jgi:two-component system LytT family response regulator
MIKTIIIEDEARSREMLLSMLRTHFADVEVLAVCSNIEEGKAAIEGLRPDLVLSDIELGEQQAFDMLLKLNNINFEIIFTTAHEHYAIKAIKFSALDYLLKPFSVEDLTEAIDHYRQKKDRKQSSLQLQSLFHNLKHIEKDSKKIVLPTQSGYEIISVKEIIRCKADINYTTFYLLNGSKMVVSKTLKEFEDLLNDYDFIRVHNSHLINLHHIKNYTRGEGGVVTMTDGTEVDVSRRKKDEFLKRLAAL